MYYVLFNCAVVVLIIVYHVLLVFFYPAVVAGKIKENKRVSSKLLRPKKRLSTLAGGRSFFVAKN